MADRSLSARLTASTYARQDGERGTALADFLQHVVPYEVGGPIPRPLLLFGVLGSGLLLVSGLLALVLPAPEAIQDSQFFWFEAAAAAVVVSAMKAIALPAIAVAAVALAVDVYLANGRHGEHWRPVIGVQSVAGNLSAALSAVFLAFVVFIVVVYILIGILAVAALCFALWTLAHAASG